MKPAASGRWIAWVVQALLLAAIAGGAVWLVLHALGVLRARGVQSGFDFLLEAGSISSRGNRTGAPFWQG